MESVALTVHSMSRILERFGAEDIGECQLLALRAWKNGKNKDDFRGRMKKMLYKAECRCPNIKLKIHAKNCYVFTNDGVLITAYSLERIYDDYVRAGRSAETVNDEELYCRKGDLLWD